MLIVNCSTCVLTEVLSLHQNRKQWRQYFTTSIASAVLHHKYYNYCKSIVSQILQKYCITARWQAGCSRVIVVGMEEEDGTGTLITIIIIIIIIIIIVIIFVIIIVGMEEEDGTGTMLTARHHSDHVCLLVWILLSNSFAFILYLLLVLSGFWGWGWHHYGADKKWPLALAQNENSGSDFHFLFLNCLLHNLSNHLTVFEDFPVCGVQRMDWRSLIKSNW